MSAPSALDDLTVPETPSIADQLATVSDHLTAAGDHLTVAGDHLTRDTLLAPVHFVGFWTAVSLPFLHVPLLASGLDTVGETTTFLALLALNVLAFVLGQPYKAD